MIDSTVLPPSELAQARSIEEEIFLNVKKEVEKELDDAEPEKKKPAPEGPKK